jgi:hypothetical protein
MVSQPKNITGLPYGSGMSAQRVWEWIEWPLFAGASGERSMKKTILVVGFACLSMVAVAQSTSDKKAAAAAAKQPGRGISSPTGADKTVAPRDIATGQASGKVAQSHEIKSPRDNASGQASGRVAATNTNGSASNQANAKGSAHAVENVSTDNSNASVKPVSTTTRGGVMASDDWESPKAKTAAPGTKAPTTPSDPQEQRMHKPMTVSK